MPITEELNNIRKLESVGFNHEQAETLAEVIEKAQSSGSESLKEFITNVSEKQTQDFDIKLGKLETLITASQKDFDIKFNKLGAQLTSSQKDFDIKLGKLKTRIMASQKDMLIKIFGIVAGCTTVAVTILKLFP